MILLVSVSRMLVDAFTILLMLSAAILSSAGPLVLFSCCHCMKCYGNNDECCLCYIAVVLYMAHCQMDIGTWDYLFYFHVTLYYLFSSCGSNSIIIHDVRWPLLSIVQWLGDISDAHACSKVCTYHNLMLFFTIAHNVNYEPMRSLYIA